MSEMRPADEKSVGRILFTEYTLHLTKIYAILVTERKQEVVLWNGKKRLW